MSRDRDAIVTDGHGYVVLSSDDVDRIAIAVANEVEERMAQPKGAEQMSEIRKQMEDLLIEGRLREWAAKIEAEWRRLSDGERVTLMALCCRGCGSLDTSCQCWNDE